MHGLGQARENEQQLDSRRYLLRRFWTAALGYWRLAGGRSAWLLSCGLLALILFNLGTSYGINIWNRAMFDALEQRDSATALFQALIYFPLMAASVGFGVLMVYARMTMQRLWRAWLNGHLLERWLANGRCYQLNLVKGEHANPEYRLAEDLRIATEAPVDFAVGLTTALLSAGTFIFVLWTIGGALSFEVAGSTITIPGFLVLAAVIYALLASGCMVFIGRRFVAASERKSQAEAEYRYILTRLRENAESITLLRGEAEERRTIERSFGTVLHRWRDICIQIIRTTVVSQASGYFAPVLPILLCAPKFLDSSMTLGEVMQAVSAFTVVHAAFSWLVDNYSRLSDWSACARRVSALMVALDGLEHAENGGGAPRIRHAATDGAGLRLRDLSVTLDNGVSILHRAEVTIASGERVLVVGESGTGKSSLVRAIGGQWPWGKGEVQTRRGSKMLVLPQRPYIPLGTLLRAAAYPLSLEEVDRQEVVKALSSVGLGHFLQRLDEDAAWEQTLSGGEKQRLAFARLLIARPDIVVMDEATSALDPSSQRYLMELMHERLHAATIIGVGHRPELEAFYDRKIELVGNQEGARLTPQVDLTRLGAPARQRDRIVKLNRLLPARAGALRHAAASVRSERSVMAR
jgi:putative ATP-binding cassette transporter